MKLFFVPVSCPFQATVSRVFLLGLILSLPRVSEAQTQIFKANQNIPLDQANSWVGGVVPSLDNVVVYSGSNTTTTTGTIGGGLNVAGILFSTNPGTSITISNATGGTGVLGLGASGIDIRVSTNRTLTISTPIILNADQTWYTGLTNANTAMITASGVISGTGKLTISGASSSSNQFVFLSGVNTFSGGVVLNAGGAVRGSSSNATVSGTSVTASAYGTGPLTVNGGTVFGNSGQLGFSTITVNGDFAVNKGTGPGVGVNGRLTLGGGFDLGGATRTITVGGYSNSVAGVLVSGKESIRLMPVSTTLGPSNTVANGTVRLVRDTSGVDGTDFAAVNFGAGVMLFSGGAGLTIGNGILTTMGTSNPFGSIAGDQPRVTVESGGYFNMSDATAARTPSVRTLSGAGVVTSLANAASASTSLLTINAQTGDSATFSGQIVDGNRITNSLGSNVVVALTKSGAGTQIFSGSNNFSGATLVTGGELRFLKRNSLYAGNTNLWAGLSVTSNATLGLSLGGAEGFVSPDLDVLAANANIMKAGSKLGLDVASSNGPVTLSTVFSNSANPNGITFSKSGDGQLNLSGYTGTYTNPVTISGGTLKFTQLSTYSGTPSISGGGVLDLGGANFPIPNTVTLTDGSMVNFTPGVSDPFAPTSNLAYSGFSFGVNGLNDGTNGARTFTLTNSVLTVGGEVATNGFTISGASNGIMRFTGQTLGQGDTNTAKGEIKVNGSAILEFARNSLFDSYRSLSVSSASNPTILVSGGTVTNLNYVIFGAGSGNRGTLRVTDGALAIKNPTSSQNGLYFGQNAGEGAFLLEGGSVSSTVIKVQSGTANINISGGTLNLVTTNAAGSPASAWSLSTNGTVNFTMLGGTIVATNSRFNVSSGVATSYLTNVTYLHAAGTISSVEMSAGAGSFTMNGGTNDSSAGMFVGDNPFGAASFTQNAGLVRIKGESGSTATNDLVIGSAGGNGTYILNGGVLEVFGKIRKNSGSSALVLNGGTVRYTNNINQAAFISSLVDTTVGSSGAIFDITDSGVTNTIQASLNDVSGQAGQLIKRGDGALAIGRANLAYTGPTSVEDGLLIVSGTTNGISYSAQISSNAINMILNPAPSANTPASDTFSVLPGSLSNGITNIISAQLAPNNQTITFDPATGTATVVTTAAANPPVITSPDSFSGTVGVPFSGQMTASGDGSITFSGSGLPSGLSLNTNNGLITGTPTLAGNFNATLTAGNLGGTTNQSVTFIIAEGGPTFASSYSNNMTDVAPNGLTYLVNYAFGGSSSNAAALPYQDKSDTSKLTLIAYVRTNDPTVTVKGEQGSSLSLWDTNLINGVPAGDNVGAPPGTQKQIFSVTNSGNRLFLRLKVTK